ncbi:hypothetical protein ABZ853_13395 [Streptomyces albidoflavus]
MSARTRYVLSSLTAGVLVLGASGAAPAVPQAPGAGPQVVTSPWSADGKVATVTCPAGTGLVGGGAEARYRVNGVNQVGDDLEANAPDPERANTWKTQVKKGKTRAVALCSPGAPVPAVAASDWSPRGEVATATCPAGTHLAGGGQDARLVTNTDGSIRDGVEANAPSPDRPDSWKVQLNQGQARAFALCSAEAETPTVVASDWSPRGEVASASCPAGTHMVGGGVDARLVKNGFGQVQDAVEANTPDADRAGTWKTQLKKGQARAFVMCDAKAPAPTVVASEWSPAGQAARAVCPAGTELAGGGQDARIRTNGLGEPVDGVTANNPDPERAGTWKVQLHHGQARAFAFCLPAE